MVKICCNGKLSGYNGCYDNPEYIRKQIIAQHKRFGTLDKLDLLNPQKNKYIKGNGKTKMTQKEYLKSNMNPFNNPKYHIENGKRLTIFNKDEKFRQKSMQALFKRPTLLEKKLISLIQNHNLHYKYVGDGEFILGGRNPDFININGQKICIEVYQPIFKEWNFGSCEEYEKQRSKHFAKYGWATLFIKQHEIKNLNDVINKIKQIESITLGGEI